MEGKKVPRDYLATSSHTTVDSPSTLLFESTESSQGVLLANSAEEVDRRAIQGPSGTPYSQTPGMTAGLCSRRRASCDGNSTIIRGPARSNMDQ